MAKKRRKKKSDDAADSLGERINGYEVSLGGVLVVSGTVAVVGLGLLAFAATRQPPWLVLLLIGGFAVLAAILLLVYSLLNVGRRFEVRKHGIRFFESGEETEMLWNEIADIHINRSDETTMGPVSVERRSSDYVSASGPLTTTNWEVTIQAHDGRTIRLRPTFLKLVPNVQKLVSQLRLRAGL